MEHLLLYLDIQETYLRGILEIQVSLALVEEQAEGVQEESMVAGKLDLELDLVLEEMELHIQEELVQEVSCLSYRINHIN